MIGAAVDVTVAVLATAMVMSLPGVLALAAFDLLRPLPWMLRPAASVTATILVSAPLLITTMAFGWSIRAFTALLLVTTAAAGALLVHRRRNRTPTRESERHEWSGRSIAAHAAPASILALLATIDAPQVRSDTYWHVGLARKLSELGELSSAQVAFGAGTPGNASYPLPVWHALIAVADQVPRVDVWFASWFLTVWLAPVAMFAFGAAAASLTGHRHASLAGAWTFLAIVVLGYGPWYFASRFLGYPGQVAIFVTLPIVLWAFVQLVERREDTSDAPSTRRPWMILLGAVVAIGMLHANYELYPSLFALGGATLLLVGGRDRARRAFAVAGAVVGAGAATLAAQLPWIMHDANFLRGDTPPDGAPSAFIRHRDVLTGSEELFWVKLGALAAQPWLVVGALMLPVLLWWMRGRVGPWVLAGGAFAIVVTARTPWIVLAIDAAGSITPVTRLDRIYPAAIGVLGAALLVEHLVARMRMKGRRRQVVIGGILAGVAIGTWWVDSIRDTRRIVVTPFVEARWVGGLDPLGVPLAAVWASSVLLLGVAIWIRRRDRSSDPRSSIAGGEASVASHAFATAFIVAIVAGLAPASIERAHAQWRPYAFDRSARHDRDFQREEVYPAPVRRVVLDMPPRSVVFADLANARRVQALVPVQVVGESIARELEDEPVTSMEDARARLDEPSAGVPSPDFLVFDRANEALVALVDAALACGWTDRSVRGTVVLERGDSGPCNVSGTTS